MSLQIKDHIAYRFLKDPMLTDEILRSTFPDEYAAILKDGNNLPEVQKGRLAMLYRVVSMEDQKAYYVTDTVLDKLDMLKVARKDGKYDWTIFDQVKPSKLTFIFRGNRLLRVLIVDDVIMFCHIEFTPDYSTEKKRRIGYGTSHFVHFWVDRKTGEQCDHFSHVDVKDVEHMVYRLLCFFFLSENEEIIVKGGHSHGTRKQPDALNNHLDIPITIINSRWNVTSIRTEGFQVRGHFAIRWCGVDRTDARMVFIEPFEKHGYVRKAGKQVAK